MVASDILHFNPVDWISKGCFQLVWTFLNLVFCLGSHVLHNISVSIDTSTQSHLMLCKKVIKSVCFFITCTIVVLPCYSRLVVIVCFVTLENNIVKKEN